MPERRITDIDVHTNILGLIGHPLEHSFSPRIHNYACSKLDLNFVYLCFDISPEDFDIALKGLRKLGIKGFNITIPYKQRIMEFLDQLDSMAEKIGAVNTVVNKNGVFHGYNTDGSGFLRMIKDDGDFNPEGKRGIIIGAGGAARAAGISLLEAGMKELCVINRTLDKAEELVREWCEYYPDIDIKSGKLTEDYYRPILSKMDLVVDTTPVGMMPDVEVEPVIKEETMHSGLFVVDLVYNPRETVLMKAARRAGAETLNGEKMLLYQGLEAFKLWTGEDPYKLNWPDDIFE